MPPPPLYNIPPPQRYGMPLWAKLLLSCGVLVIVLLFLLGAGLARLTESRRNGIQTTLCVDNLRTMHEGFGLYQADYDEYYPKASNWMDATASYVNQKTDFKCPIVRVAHPSGFGYAFNSKLSGTQKSKVSTPEATEAVYDSSNLERNASDTLTSLPTPPRHALQRTRATRNAPARGNIRLYADGHIAYVGPDGAAIDVSKMRMRRALFSPAVKTK